MEPKNCLYRANIRLVLVMTLETCCAKDGSSGTTDRTNRSSTPTKTQTVLQCLYILPYTYGERTEPKNYFYRPNFWLVPLVMTKEII
jgi:hypothetical protein